MVERCKKLIDSVRPEGIADLRPIKRNPYDRCVIGSVIRDIREVETLDRMPQVRRKRASHAPKLAGGGCKTAVNVGNALTTQGASFGVPR